MGERRNITLSGRHHLKELGRDGRITFNWNLNYIVASSVA
jgi:hypothetical protein